MGIVAEMAANRHLQVQSWDFIGLPKFIGEETSNREIEEQ